ncbi:synaptonemal complex protein 1-like isoform X2 [Mya arenaria]|uniref:synaptonemal complex protein 1-like isoform X2 n=1 Tax=Mya arenaria TaxID=6604 RepID=UPI0022E6723C|nr:synaptonemal complex protein 1-like isoform X2 [Mya arenaria]
MGNLLSYPHKVEADRKEKLQRVRHHQKRWSEPFSPNSLQRDRKIVLPYADTNISMRSSEETSVKMVPDLQLDLDLSQFSVETVKLSSGPTSQRSIYNRPRRYIKRYRSDEERLEDEVQEREKLLQAAIRQGHQLRAKCNRYKEELENLKALSSVDMTDVEWRRKYSEMESRYRDLREELDLMAARNKNGRDYLRQQGETIQMLNNDLQMEKLERSRILSSSLSSLASAGKVKDKKGRHQITQLLVDKHLLEDRVRDLTARNQRGRNYLTRLEAEKRDQEAMLTHLKAQLLLEKQDKEHLLANVTILSASRDNIVTLETEHPEYAQVNKKRESTSKASETPYVDSPRSGTSTRVFVVSEEGDERSTGFEIIDTQNTSVRGTVFSSEDPYEVIASVHDVNRTDGQEETGGYSKQEKRPSSPEPESENGSNRTEEDDEEYTGTPERSESPPTPPVLVKAEHIQLDEPTWDTVPESSAIDYQSETTTKF